MENSEYDTERRAALEQIIISLEAISPQRTKSLMAKYMNRHLSGLEITESQVHFILVLNDKEGVPLKTITEELKVHKSLTSRMMRVLARKGFVINTASGKEYSVLLTEKGREIKNKALAEFEKLITSVFREFSNEDLLMFDLLIKRMSESLISTLEGSD